eukprot:gb/GECG01016727.1/.p1 GENE.gb/GECG01016727.1/~~gb/GECG01016727.1/.p1  ORF type:complete len:232 (+),score=28.37 gb/GECG01016727.1/:1-696(+)
MELLRDQNNHAVVPDIASGHLPSASMDFYEPSEDTYLFLDALLEEYVSLKALNPSICMEIGPGSGVISTYFSQLMAAGPSPTHTVVFAVELGVAACRETSATCRLNEINNVEIVRDSLAESMQHRLKGKVDVILFNPPYVPTPSEEVASKSIEASWAGGVKGREVIDKFLRMMSTVLSKEGCAYMVAVAENDISDITSLMLTYRMSTQVVKHQRAMNEALYILKFQRQSSK